MELDPRFRVAAGFSVAGLGAVCLFGALQLFQSGRLSGAVGLEVFTLLSVLAVGINCTVGNVTWYVLVTRTDVLSIRLRGLVAGIATGIVTPVIWIGVIVFTFFPLRAAGVEFTAVLNSDLISCYHGVEGRSRGNRFCPWKSISSTSLNSVVA
jgi:hypothetical protein